MSATMMSISRSNWGTAPDARPVRRMGRRAPSRRPAASWTAPILWALVLASFIVLVGTLPTMLRALPHAGRTTTVKVAGSDTLWSIAAAHREAGVSTAETVDRIMAANGMTTPQIRAGMTLSVPAGDTAGTAFADATAAQRD